MRHWNPRNSFNQKANKMQKTKVETLIALCRKAYAGIDRIDPSSAAYKGICARLDQLSDPELQTVEKANIRFVSALARNRLTRRNVRKGENVNNVGDLLSDQLDRVKVALGNGEPTHNDLVKASALLREANTMMQEAIKVKFDKKMAEYNAE